LLNNLQPGDCVRGKVTNITDFGVFVDLGGVEGLVHVSEISWGRVQHPSDVVSAGQEVEAYVIQVDQERSRIALSFKQMQPNPWLTVNERYYPGLKTEAVVTSIVSFGAFARLEEGLDGLIHISEMGLEEGETTADYQFTLETVACLGACFLAPAMMVNRTYFGKLSPTKVVSVLKQFGKDEDKEN